MSKYKIIPREDDEFAVVEACNEAQAMEAFALSMDFDLNVYFKAVPVRDDEPDRFSRFAISGEI